MGIQRLGGLFRQRLKPSGCRKAKPTEVGCDWQTRVTISIAVSSQGFEALAALVVFFSSVISVVKILF
jgi:hypothetical protein